MGVHSHEKMTRESILSVAASIWCQEVQGLPGVWASGWSERGGWKLIKRFSRIKLQALLLLDIKIKIQSFQIPEECSSNLLGFSRVTKSTDTFTFPSKGKVLSIITDQCPEAFFITSASSQCQQRRWQGAGNAIFAEPEQGRQAWKWGGAGSRPRMRPS